jgi:hypothetical protein
MKKELLKAFASVLLLGSAGCAVDQFGNILQDPSTPTSTPFLPVTRTPFLPLYLESSTPTATITPTETFTPTFTALPTELFTRNGVEFTNELKEIFVTIENHTNENDPVNINFSYIPLPYPDDSTSEEGDQIVYQEFAPGSHRGLTDTDGDVIIVQLHSGWIYLAKGKYEDEAEELRKSLEGTTDSTILNPDYINSRIQRLLGSVVTIEQDGNQTQFRLVAAGIVPHEDKSAFDSDIKKTLDWAISVNPDFAIFQQKSGGILMDFCGWGPEGDPERYVYKNYIIGFLPVVQ